MGVIGDRRLLSALTLEFSIVAFQQRVWDNPNYCPKGILCGRRLKTRVRKSGVRPSVRPDFWTVSSINSMHPYRFFDRYNQGIRDHLKSADCQLLSFIGYRAQHAACQKHTFFNKKSTTRKWTIFSKLSIFGPVL